MRSVKSFEEYIQTGVMKQVTINNERARSLSSESARKLGSLKESLEKIGIKKENANDYVEDCYDILMYLLRAKLYQEGYSSSGMGAHEAEVSYLRILGFSEKEFYFMDQLRYFRNGILYYGIPLDSEYAEKVIEFTYNIYPKLKKIVR
ncbi:TPA: hypothetical protein HA242_02420 [Candidatus Woesearchaeota archaeon]|nr:hypothetical protein [Candidatus Woesearchaeota archaeon]